MRLALVALVLVGTRALAQLPPPAQRYADHPQLVVRSELERRIEGLAAEVARGEKRTPPVPDPRLEEAVTALATLGPDDEVGGPSNDLVEDALRLYGIVEPPPHLLVARAYPGSDEELLHELREQLPRALSGGRYTRVAAAVVLRNGRQRVIVALGDSYVELQPVPRELPLGGPVPFMGRLLGTFERPEAFVTSPDGKTQTMSLAGDAKRFSGTFRCGAAKGRYEIELAADDRFGATVLANFPVYCGVPAPRTLVVTAAPREAPVTDGASAERAIFALVNADRAHAGLHALTLDPKLTEIARAHSRDMQEHGYIGHVSPTTGDAAARVSRAHVAAQLVLENVARAGSPGEVERGLMDSPGHRRNLLSPEAQRIGIGVVMSQGLGGQIELVVTQLFIAAEAPFAPANPEDLRARIDQLRQRSGLPPAQRDPALDNLAASIAGELARGRLTPATAAAPIDRAISPMGARYSGVRSMFAVATAIDQVAESLNASLTVKGAVAIGLGLASGPTTAPDGSTRLAHHAVVILATPR